MTQALLQKRMHLVALATVLALVAAMFVALQSVSAAPLGACKDVGATMMGVGDTCTIDATGGGAVTLTESLAAPTDGSADETPVIAADSSGTVTVTANAVGRETVKVAIADDTTTADEDESSEKTYSFSVRKITVSKIEFGSGEGADFVADTDGVFAAGTDVRVRVTISYPASAGGAITTTVSVPSTGLSLETTGGTSQRVSDTDTDAPTEATNGVSVASTTDFVLLTDGAPEREYTVTATASQGADATLVTSDKASATLTIGSAGNVVGSATLALGLRVGYDTPADATDDKPETGSDGAAGEVNLNLKVLNGIGNAVNASDVDEIRIVAPFGVVSYYSSGSFMEVTDNTIPGSALSKGSVLVQIGSKGERARAINVHAIVLGKVSGVATTDMVTLTFTGDADSMTIDDATKTLRNVNTEKDDDDNTVEDTIKLLVTATDKGGNAASPPAALSITIADPDGTAVGSDKIDASQATQDKSGKWYITLTNKGGTSAATALKTGDYTLTAKSGSIEDTATFTVAGAVATIAVEVNDMSPTDLGQILTVVATVADEDGSAAADDTPVTFDTSDEKVAKRIGTTGDVKVKDGSASATFVVTGPGLVVLTATSGGQSAAAVAKSTAGAPEPAPEPEPEPEPEPVHDASGLASQQLNSFTSWTASNSSTASMVFASLAGRGATSIQLWNGSTWLRYSMVDGAMVPGSIDFTINTGDVIYIGG